MADGGAAGKAFDHFAAGEGVADQPEPAFAVKTGAVEGDDAPPLPGRDAARRAVRAR